MIESARNNYRPAGSTGSAPWELLIDPEEAGWDYSGIQVLALAPGEQCEFRTEDREFILVPLSGSYTVRTEDREVVLAGRASVFTGSTDVLYVPRDSRVEVTSETGGRLAMPNARARRRFPVQHVLPGDVPVEVRGAGTMSRKIFDFGGVSVLQADRLIACEVITPGGNWSSFPPHKHDENTATESQLEEIYYFEVSAQASGPGYSYMRVSSSGDPTAELLEEVRSGDVVLVPSGWHGPAMTPPGYDLYYLNVMAGSREERVWLITDEPSAAWVRDSWKTLPPDPRL
ncbi:MAG: iolB [Naasia sp.]|uniref:5-deoxy-glucuronate isomerase n=1 Tax=Naasia sp. TaxID=2546198 RepID=UPI0026319EE6|nr:5-deoxy-glucuronate isomerase [Naasia sp.]MCU1569450.1 iolB [Naasia sp.]